MNVIVYVNDSLRIDHVGCYDKFRDPNFVPFETKTPNLDRFAGHSAVFDYAYTEGLPTLPTRTAMFTGRYTFPFRSWQRLEPTDILLSEVLWEKGFNSALITDTFHMHKPSMAYERGFDFVHFVRGQEGDPYILDKSIEVDLSTHYKSDGKDKMVKQQMEQYLRNIHEWKSHEDHFMAQVSKSAMNWLDLMKDKNNKFLWVDCFDPHEPWDPTPEFDNYRNPNYNGQRITHPIPGDVEGYLDKEEIRDILGLYAGEVELCDYWFGKFMEKVEELGMLENTLIIHTTDHGEPFGEHGIIRKAKPYMYEELVHIPLMIHHPEGVGAGERFDAIAETPDIMPTVLNSLGLRVPRKCHGKSLLPVMKGEQEKLRDYAYVGQHGKCWRINDHQYSYIHWPRGDREPELYDQKADLMEQNNIIDQHPELAEKMKTELLTFVEKLK
ncbi:sulfatase [Candidatus Hydrogenedentota bacterium]